MTPELQDGRTREAPWSLPHLVHGLINSFLWQENTFKAMKSLDPETRLCVQTKGGGNFLGRINDRPTMSVVSRQG
jgi:hypothetical protein